VRAVFLSAGIIAVCSWSENESPSVFAES